MNNYHSELIKINFEYWKTRNSYYEDVPLNKSMRTGLTVVKNAGFLPNFNPKTAKEFTNKIESEVIQFRFDQPNYKKLEEVFDLIQAWGGGMGKAPYVKPKNNPSRNNFDYWKSYYLKGCKLAQGRLHKESLTELLKIENIGKSFATKHMKFWGDLPILDARISLIFTGTKNWNNYDEFLLILGEISKSCGCTISESERAIFAFSQAYYTNTDLSFKHNSFNDGVDLDIAQNLSGIWKEHIA